MLTLCATYFVEHLQFLIDRESLRILLEHTVSFLEDLATVSPTCRQDHVILKSIQRVIFSYQGRGKERRQRFPLNSRSPSSEMSRRGRRQ